MKIFARFSAAIKRQYQKIQRHSVRLELEDLLRALESFGRPSPKGLLIHSALSACGYISGGVEEVLEALSQWNQGRLMVWMPEMKGWLLFPPLVFLNVKLPESRCMNKEVGGFQTRKPLSLNSNVSLTDALRQMLGGDKHA